MNKIFKKSCLTTMGLIIVFTTVVFSYLFYQINRASGEITSSGKPRSFLLYIPPTYDPSKATPLVISFHGYAEWPAHQMEISHWNDMAKLHNFIVVYPSGTEFPKHWFTGNQDKNQQDIQFIDDLIDHLQQEYNIDDKRIYANGLSNGGGMAFMLACKRSNRIAAFGGVSGAYLLPWEDCNPEQPVPAILFHGTADPIVPFGGGPSKAFDIPFPVITEWVETLAERNQCTNTTIDLPSQDDVSGIHYHGCENNADVIFYTIKQGGHSWPGGDPLPEFIVGKTSQTINATALMWDFFSSHPKED